MADVKISALPAAASVALADIVPIVKLGAPNVTDQATFTQVRAGLMPVVLSGADVSGVLPLANVGSPTGTGFPHVTAGVYDAASVSLTWTGDTTGTGSGSSFALTTVKINGATVPAAGALTTGNAPYVSGASALTYSALNLAGGAGWVTGVLPTANQASQAMAGDVTGTTAASVVAKANGATVPAAGALTTGNVLQVTGISALGYAPVNLAGGANFVTGALPTANQVSQAMAGDVTGTTAASVVAKVNGTTVTTAGGALTTDKVLRVTGVATSDWGALNLAAAAAVTGVLPLANHASPTGTGVAKVSAGAWVAAASLIVDADVNAAAAIAGTKISPDFGSQVIKTTGNVQIGTAPYASSGIIRFPYNAGSLAVTRDSGGGDAALLRGTVDTHWFGSVAATNVSGASVMLCNSADTPQLTINTTNVKNVLPIIGDGTVYGVHGAVVSAMTDADYTVPAGEYSRATILIPSTLTLTAIRKVLLPTPADEDHAYFIDMQNMTTGGFAVNVFRADGAGGQVQITNGNRAMIHMRPRGAQLRAALIGGV